MSLNNKQRSFWNILRYSYDINKEIKSNEDLIKAIVISQRIGKVINPLGNYMFVVAQKQLEKATFKGYSAEMKKEMAGQAAMQMVKSGLQFNVLKSDNPHSYLIVVCHSAFIHVLHKEHKQDNIKLLIGDNYEKDA